MQMTFNQSFCSNICRKWCIYSWCFQYSCHFKNIECKRKKRNNQGLNSSMLVFTFEQKFIEKNRHTRQINSISTNEKSRDARSWIFFNILRIYFSKVACAISHCILHFKHFTTKILRFHQLNNSTVFTL